MNLLQWIKRLVNQRQVEWHAMRRFDAIEDGDTEAFDYHHSKMVQLRQMMSAEDWQ